MKKKSEKRKIISRPLTVNCAGDHESVFGELAMFISTEWVISQHCQVLRMKNGDGGLTHYSVCNLLRYILLSIIVLIVGLITPLCNGSGAIQSFIFS